MSPDDLAREIGIALGPPLAGIPLDREVLSLDIPQPAQLLPKCLPSVTCRVVNAGGGTRSDDDRNPVLFGPLLRPHSTYRGCEQEAGREIAPPHSITSSAVPSNAGGKARPSAFAAFILRMSWNLVD